MRTQLHLLINVFCKLVHICMKSRPDSIDMFVWWAFEITRFLYLSLIYTTYVCPHRHLKWNLLRKLQTCVVQFELIFQCSRINVHSKCYQYCELLDIDEWCHKIVFSTMPRTSRLDRWYVVSEKFESNHSSIHFYTPSIVSCPSIS